MRGLQERSGVNGVFLVIKHNTICQESKTPREGFEPVDTTNKETGEVTTRYVKPYDRVEAMITNIEWSEREWRGKVFRSWRLFLDAAGVPCVLEIQYGSRVSNRFMKLAENVDFTRPVEFAAWQDRVTGNTAFMVGQREHEDDEKAISVPQKYTKDDPGDMPQPKERMGGKKLDWGDQEDFLYDRMINVVIPRVKAAVAMNGSHPEPEPFDPTAPPDPDPEITDDDIPF